MIITIIAIRTKIRVVVMIRIRLQFTGIYFGMDFGAISGKMYALDGQDEISKCKSLKLRFRIYQVHQNEYDDGNTNKGLVFVSIVF